MSRSSAEAAPTATALTEAVPDETAPAVAVPAQASPADGSPVALFAALADDTRLNILGRLGHRELSASALAAELPVSRQAIAKHLATLAEVGLVEASREGREVRYRAVGARLSAVARRLDSIGDEWDARLARLKKLAEG
jgi:DNA-binding transcriptional ArsR family regulator